MAFLTSLSTLLLDIIAPVRCICCDMGNTALCSECINDIDFMVFRQRGPPSLDSLTCMARFSGVIEKYVHQMKYSPNRPCALYAGKLLYLHTLWPTSDCVTAVPLSRFRKLERGFNQAAMMAEEFSAFSRIPYLPLLKRIKHDSPQAEVHSRTIRATRLQGRYATITTDSIPTSVLLIDDVCTSGATLEECATVLKHAGAKIVHGLTLAREF